MNNETNRPPNASYLLRLLGGGYLVYLAWDLRSAVHGSLLFFVAVTVFALVGAALFIHSLVTLMRHGYFRKNSADEPEITEDCEERSDD